MSISALDFSSNSHRCWPITTRWQILGGVNQLRSCNFMYLGYTPRNTFAELFKAELTIPKYSCIFTELGSSLTRQFNHVGYYAAKFDLANPLGITNVLPRMRGPSKVYTSNGRKLRDASGSYCKFYVLRVPTLAFVDFSYEWKLTPFSFFLFQ